MTAMGVSCVPHNHGFYSYPPAGVPVIGPEDHQPQDLPSAMRSAFRSFVLRDRLVLIARGVVEWMHSEGRHLPMPK
jgi:hypothetical protein